MVDIKGHPISIGSEIAVAIREGNVARLRVGTVVDTRPDSNQLVVEWSHGQWLPAAETTILLTKHRLVVIN